MIGKKMEKALNEQINKELYSGYLYLAMSAYSQTINLPGFAHWFRLQANEEVEHAMKMFDYINEQGGAAVLEAIEKPPTKFKSPLELFEKSLAHEQFVTKSIYGLVDLAIAEKDHATNSFLRWFVDEQVEEEAHASEILAKLNMIGGGGSGGGLLMIDHNLAKRAAE